MSAHTGRRCRRALVLVCLLALALPATSAGAGAAGTVGRRWDGPLFRTSATLTCVETRGGRASVTLANRGDEPVVLESDLALGFRWGPPGQPAAGFDAGIALDEEQRVLPVGEERTYRLRLTDAALPEDPEIDLRLPLTLTAAFRLAGHSTTTTRTFAFAGCTPDPAEELYGGILATFAVGAEAFRVWITNPATIQQVLDLQAGIGPAAFPNGQVRVGPGQAGHNAPWSWHLDPQEIELAEATIELCDGTPSYLEAHRDEWIATVAWYCPWGAALVGVEDYRDVLVTAGQPAPPTFREDGR